MNDIYQLVILYYMSVRISPITHNPQGRLTRLSYTPGFIIQFSYSVFIIIQLPTRLTLFNILHWQGLNQIK